MNKLWALGLMQAWLLLMVYGWYRNKDGHADQHNYERFTKSIWWRWMFFGRSRETFLRQHRLLHRLTIPFTLCFYLLGMWGILSIH